MLNKCKYVLVQFGDKLTYKCAFAPSIDVI